MDSNFSKGIQNLPIHTMVESIAAGLIRSVALFCGARALTFPCHSRVGVFIWKINKCLSNGPGTAICGGWPVTFG